METINKKEITDHFRSNIFEAYGAYIAWKMLFASKCTGIVSEEMARHYCDIQNYHSEFFVSAERAFLINFTVLSLHAFDKYNIAFSLRKVDAGKTETFIKNNKSVLDMLYKMRDKLFAHSDKDARMLDIKIPSIDSLDQFYKNLIDFYNELTSSVDDSTTSFSNAESIKYDIEGLFMNLCRGERVKRQEQNIDFFETDDKKASDIL